MFQFQEDLDSAEHFLIKRTLLKMSTKGISSASKIVKIEKINPQKDQPVWTCVNIFQTRKTLSKVSTAAWNNILGRLQFQQFETAYVIIKLNHNFNKIRPNFIINLHQSVKLQFSFVQFEEFPLEIFDMIIKKMVQQLMFRDKVNVRSIFTDLASVNKFWLERMRNSEVKKRISTKESGMTIFHSYSLPI